MASETTPFTPVELRLFATAMRDEHDAAKQDHPYERCELCHFMRHPCDVFDLASATLELLAEGSDQDG